jgi:predicted metalloendopeptidase
MKSWSLSLSITCTLLGACSQKSPLPAVSEPASIAPVSGLNAAYFDTVTRPQDDLYRYINGKWLDTVEIPADKARYGSFVELADAAEAQLRAIVESLQQNDTALADVDAIKVRDLYTSFMDESRLELLRLRPLQAELQAIDKLDSVTALTNHMARLAQLGVNVPLTPYVHQDNRDSTQYAVDLYQSGLGLPDRDYYLQEGEGGAYQKIRDAYRQHISSTLALAELAQAEQAAEQILTLETKLANVQWDKVVNRDPVKTYNKYGLNDLPKLARDIDWSGYIRALGVAGKAKYLLVSQPSYVTAYTRLLNQESLQTWRMYLKWQLLSAYAPYLSKVFVDNNFAFYGTVLRDIPQNRPRWKRGLTLVESGVGESLGKLYVTKHFPVESKQRMEALVANLLIAYQQSIDTLDWMSDSTKQAAKEKLGKFTVKIGYPKQWRDYSSLEIKADDLVGNVMRAQQFDYQRNIDKLGKPIDRDEWGMTPQTVNAYYNPELNEIVFPAAILQPPFFNALADDAVNYGAIGAVIGHEISHGFDDQGSQYDGDGNLRDWWTKEDHAKFAAKTKALVNQYAAYEPVKGFRVNGQLTLGENIADNSGLAIAYKAFQLSLSGKVSTKLDGLDDAQRFYAGWAQVWRYKSREKEAIRQLTVGPHSPPESRVWGAVVNQAPFYNAFDVKPGDKMYLSPQQRVSIW